MTGRTRSRSRSGDRPATPPSLPARTRTTRSRTTAPAPATSSTKTSGKPSQLAAVDLNDKAQVKAWALVLEDALDDLVVAGNKATQSRSRRVVSRAEARRQFFGAWTKALQLLGALQRGLR